MQQLEFNDDNDSTIASSVAASNENRRSAVNCQIFFDREYNSDIEEDEDEEYCDQPSQL